MSRGDHLQDVYAGTGAAISQQLHQLTTQLAREGRLWQLAQQAEQRLKAAQEGKTNS